MKHRNDKVECALANIYYQGLILDRQGMPDYCKAFFYYKLAAEKGNTEAQYKLGKMYQKGHVPDEYYFPNYVLAFYYFKEAASKGNTDAEYQVGMAYLKGQFPNIYGIFCSEPNYEKAVIFLKIAADKENPKAQYALGALYYSKKIVCGVKQTDDTDYRNFLKGYEYMKMAADQGLPIAQRDFKRLFESETKNKNKQNNVAKLLFQRNNKETPIKQRTILY